MKPTRYTCTALAALCLSMAATLAPAAFAHYKLEGEADEMYGRWYFTGSTYKERPLNNESRKDPVNVFIYGAQDGSPYTRERIETHFNDDWSTRAVGGRSWSKDSEIIGVCKDDQYVGWPFYPGGDSDRTDWHGSTSAKVLVPNLPTPVKKTACFAQHHMRFWDDWEHTKGTTSHTRYDWVVGSIHHEHPVSKVKAIRPRCCVKHKVDRDWDRVRVELTKAMRVHCSVRRWKYHPEADDIYQEMTNFGFVARLSLRHRSQGCDGA